MEIDLQENIQKQKQQVFENVIEVDHFSYKVKLQENTKIYQYRAKYTSSKKRKIKNKFDSFSYYRVQQTPLIYKILFKDNETYFDQGQFPFTSPSGKLTKFSQLTSKNVQRLKITEAAYIGHIQKMLIVKKMQDVKLGNNGKQFQTIDQNFQAIPLENQQRFGQFIKIMSMNKNGGGMSIRVIIDESIPHKPKVIDYQFFLRQRQLLSNKK